MSLKTGVLILIAIVPPLAYAVLLGEGLLQVELGLPKPVLIGALPDVWALSFGLAVLLGLRGLPATANAGPALDPSGAARRRGLLLLAALAGLALFGAVYSLLLFAS